MNQRYGQDWRDTRHGLGIGTVVTIAVVVVVLIVGGALWAGGVILSGPVGAGNAIKANNSATNRIAQQATFEQEVADYHGFLTKITIAKKTLARDTKGTAQYTIDSTNLDGVQNECTDTANDFNANSGKYLARDWKSAGLPASLDDSACTA